MKHLVQIPVIVTRAAVLLTVVALGACTAAQTDKFVAGLTNFNRGLVAVDETIKNVNSTLYKNCTSFVSVAQAIDDLSGQCSKASPYTSVANSVITTYCQASQLETNGGITASIQVTASSISQAKNTLAANKKACAGG